MNREALQKNGYLIVPGIVPAELCREVVADIDRHLEGYAPPNELDYYGMVELYHAQSMWDVRQHPAVHAAFAELFDTEKLWVSIDRVNWKPPLPEEEQPSKYGGFIHWDICINQKPHPFEVQGVVALTDTDADMGGFQCMPDLYRELDEWLWKQPCRKAQRSYLLPPYEYPVVVPEMKAGDLLVWDSFLPHGNGINLGMRTRYAQYVTMTLPGDARLGEERMNCWFSNKIPSGYAFPGDMRMLEQKMSFAKLTEFGRKLLGLVGW